MIIKPTYEELEQRIKELENNAFERKSVEEALQASEVSYRTLAENLPGLVYRVFLLENNRMHFFNDQLQSMTGYKEEELKKGSVCSIDPLILPEDLVEITTSVEEAIRKGTHFEVEYRVTHRDGDIHHFWERGRPILGGDGKPQYIDGTIFDITERKQAEEALRESEVRYRSLVENQTDFVCRITPDGTFTFVNTAYCLFLRKTKEELIGQKWHLLPVGDDVTLIQEKLETLSASNPIVVIENRILSGEGDVHWMQFLNTGIFDSSGDLQEIQSVGRDISERKRAEDSALESNEKFRSIVDNIGIGVALISPTMEILELNHQMRVWTPDINPSVGSICYRTFNNPPRDEICDYCPTCRTLQDGKVHEGTTVTPIAGGRRNYRIVSSPIFNAEGRVTAAIEMVDDITERLSLEAQLQQSQKMEAVGTLAGGIAHDFNNILAIILGNAQLASDDVPDSNPASEFLKEIHRASIRAKDMVGQLLAFSRKSDEKSAPIDIAPIIKESMKMLRPAIPSSIEFKQHITNDACNILGDVSQINQIVMNLAINAADAMSEEGGALEVTLENIILLEEKTCFDWILSPGPYVRLKMRDTGEGIEPEIMDRIFEPYFTTKEVGKGTGMGLSVIHGIVKRHGGGILVESELGKGMVFEIYFPALENKAEVEKEPEREIKGGSERILFVDDEEPMMNLYRRHLEGFGYDVKSTTKPVEALEWFKADPDRFDVIITDMTMPRMTGDKLAAEVLKIRPHMPVIICTGYSERMSAEKAEALGVRKYIEKPIDLRDLASALRDVLDVK